MATTIPEFGPFSSESIRVGFNGELRYDVDNDSLRVHDGVKEGGYEFLNRDANDGRYQARSLELDGFNFGAQGKGFLVRVGPAQYKLRTHTSVSGDLTIENPRGTAGDIDLRISDSVTTPHTWEDVQIFLSAIDATEAGLDGETRGLHIGDVVGNVTGNLTGNGTGNFTGTFAGDVDISGHDFITDPGQILETQIDPEAWIRRGVPQGAILMWSGLATAIPESFALCDGNNGTPDLRGRFVYGAGVGLGQPAPGQTGGSTNATGTGTIAVSGDHNHPLAIDGHALTIDEIPNHQHGDGVINGKPDIYNHGTITAVPDSPSHVVENTASAAGVEGLTSLVGGGLPHTHTGNTTTSGAHTHDLTLDDVSVMPPYYVLCFIMKIV